MAKLVEDASLRNKRWVFADRADAGRRLAEKLKEVVGEGAVIFAIPSGGVPVAKEAAKALGLQLRVVLVKKLLYPFTTEAGFGAVAIDGSLEVDWEAARAAGLNERVVSKIVRETIAELKRREELLGEITKPVELRGREAVVVDDGLATGLTMVVACKYVRALGSGRIVVAVPTGNPGAISRVARVASDVVCLNVREELPFAVADAYAEWHDVSYVELLEVLRDD